MNITSNIYATLCLCLVTLPLLAQRYEATPLGLEGSPIVLSDQLASTFYQTRDGFAWVGTGRDVERLDGKQPTVYVFEEIVESAKHAPQRVTALCERRDGELFVGNIQGLWRADHEAHLLRRVAADEIEGQVDALGITQDGQLLVTTAKQQYLLDDADHVREVAHAVSVVSEQRPVAALPISGKGIYILDAHSADTIAHLTAENSALQSNEITTALVLRDGSVLCGTPFYQSFYLLHPQAEGAERLDALLPPSRSIYVRSYLQTAQHRFVGTREGFYMDGRFFSMASHPALRSNIIFCFSPWRGDSILVGTCGGGLAVFHPATQRFGSNELTSRCAPQGDIFQIESDGQRTWLATSEGLYSYAPAEGLRHFTQQSHSLPGDYVYGFNLKAHRIATDGGVGEWAPSQGICSQKLTSEATRSVYRTRDGRHTLCLLLDNRVVVDDVLLPGIQAYDVTEAQDGTLYFATPEGVVRMTSDMKSYRLITEGERRLKCSAGARLSWASDGRLMVCALDGLYAVTTSLPHAPRRAGVIMNDRDDKGAVTFSCTTPDIAFLSEAVFEYKLDDEPDWKRVPSDNKLQLVGLAAGGHELRVRLLLDSDSETAVTFRVSGGFSLLYISAFVALALVAAFFAMRLYRGKREAEQPVVAEEPAVAPKNQVAQEDAERVARRLRQHVEGEKAYLNHDLKQAEVCVAIGEPTYLVSTVLSQHLHTNWYDFINAYRIAAFKEAVARGEHEKFSIVALAEQCGFKSKASFFRAFKAQTGQTPSEYIGSTKQ